MSDEYLASYEAEMLALRKRLRETAQILIAAVGADGPMDAEDAARKVIAALARAELEIALWRGDPDATLPGFVPDGSGSGLIEADAGARSRYIWLGAETGRVQWGCFDVAAGRSRSTDHDHGP